MQLLNNRYKIEGLYKKDTNGIVYEVIDLWQGNNKVLLKLCERNFYNEKIFDFFCSNFLKITGIKYKYLLGNGKFDILSVIDNKKNNKKQFFYTKEYIESLTLMDCNEELTFEQILDVARQLCDTIDYFRFRGLVYEFLCPRNIYLEKNNNKIKIKLRDIASVREIKIKDSYDEKSRLFIAPEFFLNQEDDNPDADIYSIGMILKFLLEKYLSRKTENTKISKHDKRVLFDLIDRMTKKAPESRERDLRLMIETINSVSKNYYYLNFKKEREKLNFSTELIGRDREVNELEKIGKEFENRYYVKKVLAIKGESGIGKTRLLKEMSFRLRMSGNAVYYTSVSNENSGQLGPIIKILRQMIKSCGKELVDKYGCELVKIIPELRALNNIAPSSTLSGERERLRLYDRISNFIADFIKDKPTYIIIDELHNCEIETLKVINYFMKNKQKSPLLFIVSYNEGVFTSDVQTSNILDNWKNFEEVKKLNLLKFNLQETVLMIKNTLGISYRPMKFGTRIMNETSGNPRHIEEVMKNLYASGELFIDETGVWDLKTELYSNIHIPSNIDEAIKYQIDLLEEDMYEVAKIVALFRTSVSRIIISDILDLKEDELDVLITKLIDMKIIDERVEDWGYTYDFYNIQIKKYIYHSIEEKEREELHRLVAKSLETIYIDGKKGNIDELIYHLNLSNQIDKAINYTIDLAKSMEGLVGNVQAITLWQKAIELLKDRLDVSKLEVLVNLGRLYASQGTIDKALDMLEQALVGAEKLNENKYIVLSKNIIADILVWRNSLDVAEKYIEESKKLAKEIDFVKGYLEASRIFNRMSFLKSQYDKVYIEVWESINLAKEEGYHVYLGHFYNHLGVYYMFEGQADKARECYENSIKYFTEVEDYIQSTKAINNIGIIYADYYDNLDKAMEYFEKGLKISKKYNSFENEIVFLINIGETYIQQDKYENAKKYISEAQQISQDIGDEFHLFATNVTLGKIYLKLGEIDRCYKHYKLVKEKFKKHPEQGENIQEYYDFLGEFYLTLGEWDKLIECCHKSKETANKIKLIFNADFRLLVAKFYKDGILDQGGFEELILRMEKHDLNSILRRALLDFAKLSFLAGDVEYAKLILEIDGKISNKFTTDLLELKNKLLECNFTKDSIDMLITLEKKAKNNFLESEIYINRTLGNKFRDNNKYYQSIYYYIITLELFHRIVKKMPNKEMGKMFLKRHNVSKLLKEIEELINLLSNENTNTHLTEEIFFKEHFDLKEFKHLLDRNAFYRAVFKHFNDLEFENIESVEQLVQQFTDNYKENLELITKFAVRETFASRGFIYTHDKEKNEFKVITSTVQNQNMGPVNRVISRVRQRGEGLLVQATSKSDKEFIYSEDDIKAFICIPIFKKKKLKEVEVEEERRKLNHDFNSDEIIGYIYLDSDRLFNKIDKEKYKVIEALTYLAYMNIDNYNLKQASSIDMLTGVYTREYFYELSKELLGKSKIEGLKMSVMMVDIDKFKVVNDTFGHRKGDEVLSKVGEILLENVRSTDIVGRYGGEEFIIVLPNCDEEEGKKVAEKVRGKIEGAKVLGEEHPLTVSLGVSVFPQHGQSKEELIEKADQALYKAKETGRNRSVIWSSGIENVNKRLDRLVGIVTGNTVQDRRNVLAMVEIIDLIKQDIDKEEKIYRFLGRLIEVIEGNQGILFTLDDNKQIDSVLGRQILKEEWTVNPRYNEKVIQRVIDSGKGEFLIDWEDVEDIDVLTGTPNWQSTIVTPIVYKGKLRGVLQISVPIKQKEFDYDAYNLVNTFGEVIAAII